MYIEIIISYNNQRQKSFSQLMREADALEKQLQEDANSRKLANLRQRGFRTHGLLGLQELPERRNSDTPADLLQLRSSHEDQAKFTGRTDVAIAKRLGLGGKDLYRQARAIWHQACQHDVRARLAWLKSTQAPKLFMLLIKTYAGELNLQLILNQHPTTFGHSAIIQLLEFRILARPHQQLLLILCTTFPPPAGLLSIPWLGVEQSLTCVSPWGDAVWHTIFNQPALIYINMISARDYRRKPKIVILSFVILLIIRCWPIHIRQMVLLLHP